MKTVHDCCCDCCLLEYYLSLIKLPNEGKLSIVHLFFKIINLIIIENTTDTMSVGAVFPSSYDGDNLRWPFIFQSQQQLASTLKTPLTLWAALVNHGGLLTLALYNKMTGLDVAVSLLLAQLCISSFLIISHWYYTDITWACMLLAKIVLTSANNLCNTNISYGIFICILDVYFELQYDLERSSLKCDCRLNSLYCF